MKRVVKIDGGCVEVEPYGANVVIMVDQNWDFAEAKLTDQEAFSVAAALVDVACNLPPSSPLQRARCKAEFADKLWRESWNETIEASGAGQEERQMLAQRLRGFLASLDEEARSC